jgi:hypothetical protein
MRLQPEGGLAQAALTRQLVARQQPLAAPPFCAPQVKLLDRSSPFTSKANVVAYYRHVPFASDDPADAARHRAPGPIGTTRIEEAFVHELPEEFVGSVFAQADLVAYERDLGVWVYLVSPALALLDSREHLSALVVGKLCRHYAPLPLVPPPIVRLPDHTTIHSPDAARTGAGATCPSLFLVLLTEARPQAEMRRGVFSNSAQSERRWYVPKTES